MFRDYTSVLRAVRSGFDRQRVMVVGDIMLDQYVWGDVRRISPEAPVPIVHVKRRTESLGGCANVAVNLARLGLRVSVAGIVGRDTAGDRVIALLRRMGVDTGAIVKVENRGTTTKTRIVGGHQQMVRFDDEDPSAVDEAYLTEIVSKLQRRLERCDAVVLSDYAKGVLTPRTCREAIRISAGRGIPTIVDPKGKDYSKYARATVLTPNLNELSLVMDIPPDDLEALLIAAAELREQLGVTSLVVTQGEHGIGLIDARGTRHFPAAAREVFDVSGAGDTVASVITAAHLAKLDIEDAVRLANVAAGVVVGRVGTVPIDRDDLAEAVAMRRDSDQNTKIMDEQTLARRIAEWRGRGDRIVFTNGCFDIVHAGHVSFLEQASHEGHRLIVGLNTDESVRRLKGDTRPIMPLSDRARVLASLTCVDAVVPFEQETPIKLIRMIEPDVLVKGDDYMEENVVGAKETKAWNGRVVLIPILEGRSTTSILNRIRDADLPASRQNLSDSSRATGISYPA